MTKTFCDGVHATAEEIIACKDCAGLLDSMDYGEKPADKKSYKVEISETQKYVFDVQADSHDEAEKLGEEMYQEACKAGTYHYHESGDAEVSTFSYDVTGTDDAPQDTECYCTETELSVPHRQSDH